MAANTDTVSRILDGALHALARRGLRKLSMSDVCEEAGISRGTLYRYFKNKDAVLEAIGHHVETSLKLALQRAVEERPDPEDRVIVVMGVIINYDLTHPETTRTIELEPAFGLSFVRRVFPQFLAIVSDSLGTVLADSLPVRSGALSMDQLAEILMRIAVSHFFVPSQNSDELPGLLAGLAGLHPATQPAATR
ncbi:MAG: transcriptional regulator, TetR family [Pseudonocardia sp.]|nr:transcriptional regulator, TetR family [Pseudonocardia sp.]MDT7618392.1 hypothetical protein [Pseudonocardiales bacterium]